MTGLRVLRDEQIARGEAEPAEPTELPDPAARPWSSEEMLLALIAEEIRNLQYMYARTHMPKGQKIAPPSRIPRPGVKPQISRSKLSLAERALLDPRLRQRVAETGAEGRRLADEITAAQRQASARVRIEDNG